MATLTTVPDEIKIGDTLAWTASFADYLASSYPSASGWALKYYFTGYTTAGALATFNISATVSGDTWLVSVLPATTAAYIAGDYQWAAVLEQTTGTPPAVTERHTIAEGRTSVKPGFFSPGTYDGRSTAKKILDAIEALLLDQSSKAAKTVLINTGITLRSRENFTPAELIVLRDRYAAIYQSELRKANMAAGKKSGNSIRIRFTR